MPPPRKAAIAKQIAPAAKMVVGAKKGRTTEEGCRICKGDKIRPPGLGILQVRARPARVGRNPATGESIKIAASKKIAFRPAKELKAAV